VFTFNLLNSGISSIPEFEFYLNWRSAFLFTEFYTFSEISEMVWLTFDECMYYS